MYNPNNGSHQQAHPTYKNIIHLFWTFLKSNYLDDKNIEILLHWSKCRPTSFWFGKQFNTISLTDRY